MLLDATAALRALAAFLAAQLQATEPNLKATVLLRCDEIQEQRQSKHQPLRVLLDIESDEHSTALSSGARPRRMLAARGEVQVDGFSGGTVRRGNPVSTDVVTVQAIQRIVGDNQISLGDSGLILPAIRVGRRSDGTADNADLRENEFRLSVVYLPLG